MRNFLLYLFALICINIKAMAVSDIDYKKLPDEFYKQHLSGEEYYICRQGGTEHAFTGEYDKHYEDGTYTCKCCGGDHPLFSSNAKYDSQSGWPSFWEAIDRNNIELVREGGVKGLLLGRRMEVRCSRCGSHLGHVFNDGPQDKTGKRFCVNSKALDFVPKGSEFKNVFTTRIKDKKIF